MKTIDKTVFDLCDEVDYWKEQAEYWKAKYEEERKKYDQMLNENLDRAKQGVANALKFALSVQEGEDGSLLIPKENRQQLAKDFKS